MRAQAAIDIEHLHRTQTDIRVFRTLLRFPLHRTQQPRPISSMSMASFCSFPPRVLFPKRLRSITSLWLEQSNFRYKVLNQLYETIKCSQTEDNKYLVALSNSLSDLLCLSNQLDHDDDAGLRARANKESEWEIFIDPTTPQIYLPFTSLSLKRLRCKWGKESLVCTHKQQIIARARTNDAQIRTKMFFWAWADNVEGLFHLFHARRKAQPGQQKMKVNKCLTRIFQRWW